MARFTIEDLEGATPRSTEVVEAWTRAMTSSTRALSGLMAVLFGLSVLVVGVEGARSSFAVVPSAWPAPLLTFGALVYFWMLHLRRTRALSELARGGRRVTGLVKKKKKERVGSSPITHRLSIEFEAAEGAPSLLTVRIPPDAPHVPKVDDEVTVLCLAERADAALALADYGLVLGALVRANA